VRKHLSNVLRRLADVVDPGPRMKNGAIPDLPVDQKKPTPQERTDIDARLSGWFQQDSGHLYHHFDIKAEHTVADIGCGNAPFTHFCAMRGAEIYFADIAAENVASVERSLKGTPARGLHPIVSDCNPIPIPDGTADRIVCMEVLEHVEDPDAFMTELFRIGKPGAVYLLTVPDGQSERIQQSLAPDIYFQKPNHIRIFDRDAFGSLVERSGLTIIHRSQYGFFWALWWYMFWACEQDLGDDWHPVLAQWTHTWADLLGLKQGPRIKQVLDAHLGKSQAIIAVRP
jgi:SAM-dependent methyltransferase